jgi:long-subunit fatty acid transport protein
MFKDLALADTTFTGTPPPAEVEMKSTIEFPWITGIGLIYNLSTDLHVNFDLLYNLWGNVQNEMKIQFNDQTWNNGLAERDSVTGIRASSVRMPAENNLEIGVGLEYFSSSELVLRAGYRFSQSPNKPETYNLSFPTVSQHWLSAGIGFVEENYQINLAAAYAFGVSRDVEQAENEFHYGQYDGQTFIPAISFLYQF